MFVEDPDAADGPRCGSGGPAGLRAAKPLARASGHPARPARRARPYHRRHEHRDPGHDTRGDPRHPHRAGLHGRDGGPGGRPLRRLHPARRPQLPDLRPADAAPLPARAGAGQARGRRDERRASDCSTPPKAAGDRRRRARRRRAAATTSTSRSTSTRRVRAPSTNTNMNEVIAHLASARLGGAKVHPNDDVNKCQIVATTTIPTALQLVGRRGDRGGADPGPHRPPGGAGGEGGRVLGRRQDRSHPPPGRDADPPRPGVRGLRGPGRGGDPARPGRARRAAHRAARRDGGRDRDQRPPGVRGAGLRPPVRADRPPRPRGAQPLPRPGDARRRRSRPTAACGRSRSGCGRSRRDIRLHGHGPAGRHRGAGAARDPAGLLDHAGQGEPGHRRVA